MKKITEKVLTVFVLFCMIVFVMPGITAAQVTTPQTKAAPTKPEGEIILVVRGDDMGMTEGCLEGFERAFNHGILTSGAIQVPAPWFEAAAALAKKNPGWCVGVHLCLVAEWIGYRWRPVLPWDQVKSLVDEDGFLFQNPRNLTANKPRLDEMEAELRAQIELALKKGVNVGYLDVHYGGIDSTIVNKLAREYNLPISGSVGETRIPVLSGGYTIPGSEKTQALVKALSELTPGLYYLVCHIGIDSPEQNALIHASGDVFPGGGVGKYRAAELEAICSNDVRNTIIKKGIRLLSYRQLWEMQKKK